MTIMGFFAGFFLQMSAYAQERNQITIQKEIETKLTTYRASPSANQIPEQADPKYFLPQLAESYSVSDLCKAILGLSEQDFILIESQMFFIDDCEGLLTKRSDELRFAMAFDFAKYQQSSIGSHSLIQALGAPRAQFQGPHYEIKNPSAIYDRDSYGNYHSPDLKKGEIILTFDDGPHPKRTREVYENLRSYGVQAVFFAMAPLVEKHRSLVWEMDEAGHIFASHTIRHPNLVNLNLNDAEIEIVGGHRRVMDVIGKDSGFFRFPYGSRNNSLRRILENRDISYFFWNMDSLDWKLKDPETLYENVAKQINEKQKGVLLFHDIHMQTSIALPRILGDLKAAGYQIRLAYPAHWRSSL